MSKKYLHFKETELKQFRLYFQKKKKKKVSIFQTPNFGTVGATSTE